jgi:hypothetical protein
MTQFEKNMAIVLSVSTAVMLLNVFAVSTGIAEPVYSRISVFLGNI